jgi:hypothetical protein
MTQQWSQRALRPWPTRLSTAKLHAKSEYSKHSSLFKELGLEEVNKGVYNGKWSGEGPLVHSYNPATNQIIGSTRTVNRSVSWLFVLSMLTLRVLLERLAAGNRERTS